MTVTANKHSGYDIRDVITGVFFYVWTKIRSCLSLQLLALEAPQRYQDEQDAQDCGGNQFRNIYCR